MNSNGLAISGGGGGAGGGAEASDHLLLSLRVVVLHVGVPRVRR